MAAELLRLVVFLPSACDGASRAWYHGIDSVKVLSPSSTIDWGRFYQEMHAAEFSDRRWAILMTAGHYDTAEIGVGYYTSIIGVGSTRDDVVVKSVYVDNKPSTGTALTNFWRSVEGLTTSHPSITWATSQACPMRRVRIKGDLFLSETLDGRGWSSGGFISDAKIHGRTHPGTQQQFFFRNSEFKRGVACEEGYLNFVFVGTGQLGHACSPPKVSQIPQAPIVAEKPFLVESHGLWHIVVPQYRHDAVGPSDESLGDQIPLDDVFVAREGDTAEAINAGIVGKRALLLTPAIYGLNHTIRISEPSFVVLGIGFPTLVSTTQSAAISIESNHVRVAGLLLEAGVLSTSVAPDPLLHWKGDFGVISDIFVRVGAFKYERAFHESCSVTRGDVMVQIDGRGVVLDNAWLWHADHDDCGGSSDSCFSGHGLVVNGDSVVTYGLMVEHQLRNMLQWNGDHGHVFFFQSELPYHDASFGSFGFVGYSVSDNVTAHHAIGLGVYLIGDMKHATGFHVPTSADMQNLVVWHITGNVRNFESTVCNATTCIQGDCDQNKCRVSNVAQSLNEEPKSSQSLWMNGFVLVAIAVSIGFCAFFVQRQRQHMASQLSDDYFSSELCVA
mmetsp:Transcript_86730/g.136833  ORF Transcript_86730/g.136833 Transcript_86730/m.136833 type:complete len:615 (-) Transcript_86730:57-1901(-)